MLSVAWFSRGIFRCFCDEVAPDALQALEKSAIGFIAVRRAFSHGFDKI